MTEAVIAATRRWVEEFVVSHELCPFARRELESERLRFTLSEASSPELLLEMLKAELAYLDAHAEVETTLIIHPGVLADFYDFNAFLGEVDRLLKRAGYEGVYQVASFHPQYQFAGTEPAAAENYSNRSPYPMLHLLREDSVARAIAAHPDIEGVPARNIALLNDIGAETLRAFWLSLFTGDASG